MYILSFEIFGILNHIPLIEKIKISSMPKHITWEMDIRSIPDISLRSSSTHLPTIILHHTPAYISLLFFCFMLKCTFRDSLP